MGYSLFTGRTGKKIKIWRSRACEYFRPALVKIITLEIISRVYEGGEKWRQSKKHKNANGAVLRLRRGHGLPRIHALRRQAFLRKMH
jgi:hypothetical protein